MPSWIERWGARLLPRLPEAWLERAGERPEVRGTKLDAHLSIMAGQAGRSTPFYETTPGEARAALDASLALAAAPLRPLERIEQRRVPGAAGPLEARVYVPSQLEGPRPLWLYFHQGGCVIGNPDWCAHFCSVLAERTRAPVLAVDYRKGPEHRFPAAQEDAWAVYRWALDAAEEVGGDPTRLAVGGDSAGGGLAATIAQRAVDEKLRAPLLQLLVYPWLEAFADNASYRDCADAYPLTPQGMRWFLENYATPDDASDPRLAPALRSDLSGLAPALVYTAGFDVLRDEGEDYAQRLEAAGVPTVFRCYASLCHSFTAFAGASPAVALALDEIARDADRVLSRSLGAPAAPASSGIRPEPRASS
ncbi:MAG: alpha/beta hydrolase [Myxococcota bacterium]